MILIDPPVWRARGRTWSHLASDASYAELHEFARRAGLHPLAYDGDHYDVPADRYGDMVTAGAVECTARDILARVHRAGLRFRKRRGERPLAALFDGLPSLGVPHRLDLVASDREPPEGTTVAVVTFVADPHGRILLVRSERRDAWEGPGGWREPGESPRDAAVREVAEETGVRLVPSALTPVGYERIIRTERSRSGRTGPPPEGHPRPAAVAAGRLGSLSHIAVYRAAIGPSEPCRPRSTSGPEAQAVGWFTPAELPGLCGDLPWWPILDRLLRAEDSQARNARSVR